MPPFQSCALALLALAAVPVHSTSYTAVPAPDVLTVIYPGGESSLGQNITIASEDIPVPVSAYAFIWNTTTSLRTPHGDVRTLGSFTVLPSGCQPSTVEASVSAPQGGPLSISFIATQTGNYTVIWEETYYTTDNAAANGSSCNQSQLSAQSWTKNVSFAVVSEENLGVTLTKTNLTLSPAPTGKIWVPNSNSARSMSFSVALLISAIVCAMIGL